MEPDQQMMVNALAGGVPSYAPPVQPQATPQGLSPDALAALFFTPTLDKWRTAYNNDQNKEYQQYGEPHKRAASYDARTVEPRGDFVGPGPKVGRGDFTYDSARKVLNVDLVDAANSHPGVTTQAGAAMPRGVSPTAAAFRANDLAFSLGPKEVRSGIKALQNIYPDMQRIEGLRISGARELQRAEDLAKQYKSQTTPDAPYYRLPKRAEYATINVKPVQQPGGQQPGFGAPGQRLTDIW